jgi:hypothetical protein
MKRGCAKRVGRSSLLFAFTACLAVLPDRRIAMKINDGKHKDV